SLPALARNERTAPGDHEMPLVIPRVPGELRPATEKRPRRIRISPRAAHVNMAGAGKKIAERQLVGSRRRKLRIVTGQSLPAFAEPVSTAIRKPLRKTIMQHWRRAGECRRFRPVTIVDPGGPLVVRHHRVGDPTRFFHRISPG